MSLMTAAVGGNNTTSFKSNNNNKINDINEDSTKTKKIAQTQMD